MSLGDITVPQKELCPDSFPKELVGKSPCSLSRKLQQVEEERPQVLLFSLISQQ